MNTDNPQSEPLANAEADENSGNSICPTCGSEHNFNAQFWIRCDKCKIWYHNVCEGVESNDPDKEYICTVCRNKSKLYLKDTQCRKSPTNCKAPRQ